MLYDYLLEIFGKNEPIFLSDIHYEDYSDICLLYTSPSPRDGATYRMPSSA